MQKTIRVLFIALLTFGFTCFYAVDKHALRFYKISKMNVAPDDKLLFGEFRNLTKKAEEIVQNMSEIVIAERFANRLRKLHERCPNDYTKAKERLEWVPNIHFLVDVPKKLLVCAVPKSGSSTWHGLVWSLRRRRAGLDIDQKYYKANDTKENHAMSKTLSKQDGKMLGVYQEGDENITDTHARERSHRLILARHPFARLISGWRDKFRVESNSWKTLFERYPVLLNYRVSTPPTNYSMAFEDFAKYIAENGLDMRALEYHFRPATSHCEPCKYSYTYILKAECVDEDKDWLMDRLNLTDIVVVRRGVRGNLTLLQRNPSDSIKEMFANLDVEIIKKLYTVYVHDFVYFGYTFNFSTRESGGFD